MTLAQKQTPGGLQDLSTAVMRCLPNPSRILGGYIEQGHQGKEMRLQRTVEHQNLAGDLLSSATAVILRVDVEAVAEQIGKR